MVNKKFQTNIIYHVENSVKIFFMQLLLKKILLLFESKIRIRYSEQKSQTGIKRQTLNQVHVF